MTTDETPRKTEIDVLIIEDDPNDATLIGFELRRAGIPYRARRITTEAEFIHELSVQLPDIILADHGLPAFDGFTALQVARERCPDIPFLFVTGSLGEEMIIETLQRGATDYVLKHRLSNGLMREKTRRLR